MHRVLILALLLCLLAACGSDPTPPPDLVATQIAVEIAAHATMTAMVPTATNTPEPTETVTPTETPVPSVTPTPAPTVTPPPSIEAEEYAVYSAMIEQGAVGYRQDLPLLIREHTMAGIDDMFERALEQHDPLPAGLADSYRSRNGASYSLSPNLELDQDYAVMSREEYDQIFPQGKSNWQEFGELYPEVDGLVQFSRVGFSADGNAALVEVGFRCGDLCVTGGLYLLEKEDGSWKVQGPLLVWEA